MIQCIFQTDALSICTATIRLYGVRAGKRRGPKKAAPKARPFFIRPVHQPNRQRWLAREIFRQAADHFEACKNTEGAIEPSTIWHGVKGAAEYKTPIRLTAKCRP